MRDEGNNAEHARTVDQIAVEFFYFFQVEASRPYFVRIIGPWCCLVRSSSLQVWGRVTTLTPPGADK